METEKAAISLICGLRQKFARERGKGKSYSSDELHMMLSESMKKIKIGEGVEFVEDTNWDDVNEQIEKSGIKRYPWKKIFGSSLTRVILRLKKHGFTSSETILEIGKDPFLRDFLERNHNEREKILENIRISVHARYGENNTAKEVMDNE